MNEFEAKKQIRELSEVIEEHNYKYYILDQPGISDVEYDSLLKKLIQLETLFPRLQDINSPSQRVGTKIRSAAKAVRHKSKMYSLDNTYSVDGLKEWNKRVIKGLPDQEIEYVVELKIDGVSAALTYKNGRFVLGATRGDGIRGEDVTGSLRTVRPIPLKLKEEAGCKFPEDLNVRAEIYMDRKDFGSLNRERKKNGEVLFANPRNAASGSVKLLDSRIAAGRKLKCFVHSFGVLEGREDIESQWQFLKAAGAWGFCVDKSSRLCKTIDDVISYCMKFQEKRGDISYEVDGVVVKVNSLAQQKRLGETLKSPRWAVAYKFPASRVTTKIRKIIIQVGRTGILTPVAELEAVWCGGVSISRATLHNFDEVQRLGVKEGDRVLVERAGDVIPKIIKVVEPLRQGKGRPFIIPDKCPECGGEVIKEDENDVAYICSNPLCAKQLEMRIIHFASRGAMDIEGLGKRVVAQLLDKKSINDMADIYSLKRESLLNLELFKEKKADNLIAAINNSKKLSLSRFLFGLGIVNVGEKAAYILAREFKTLDKLISAGQEDLERIHEIGKVTAESVVAFFGQDSVKKLIEKFRRGGLNFKESDIAQRSEKLKAKKFVFTGELNFLTRKQAGEMVRNLGGEVSSSVSKNTDFVVAGISAGSKYKKASALGVMVLSEEQFRKMVGE